MNQTKLLIFSLIVVFNISAFAEIGESDPLDSMENVVNEPASSEAQILTSTRNQLSADYVNRLNQLSIDIGQTANSNFATNVRNVLSNFQCGQEKGQAPQLLLACDYPKSSSNRRSAKCFLINNQSLKIVATTSVVYGQGGLVPPGRFRSGQNKTPLGLFELSNPSNRMSNPRSPSQIARITNSLWSPQQNANLEGLGPIFYPEEDSRVLRTSLGSPIFYGEGSRQILNEMSGQRTMMMNSTEGVNVPARCTNP
jgi:hypothetical protein